MKSSDRIGLTLIELSCVVVILSVLSFSIVVSIRSFSSTQAFVVGQVEVAEIGDRLVKRIVKDASASARIFSAGESSQAFLERMNLDELKILQDSRLPALTDVGLFEPDVDGRADTGNMLFMACSLPDITVDLAGDGSDKLRVDCYEFVLYCLSVANDERLDINRWTSAKVVRFDDVASIEDDRRRTEVARRLYDQGIRFLWDLAADPDDAFHELSEDGSVAKLDRGAQIDPGSSGASGILRVRRAEIARNGKTQGVDVPRFAKRGESFPHGFETKIDGAGDGRLVLIRLVIARHSPGLVNVSEIIRLVSSRGI